MIKEILNKFNIEGELINITENHSGNINKTFVATFKRKDGSEKDWQKGFYGILCGNIKWQGCCDC